LKRGATLKKRFLALFLDYLIILCYMAALFGVNMFIYLVILDGTPRFDELGMNLISLTLIVPVLLYSIIMEASKKHATVGKLKMKISVASVKKGPVKPWQIIVRNLIKFLPWQLAHMAIFRGFALNWNLIQPWNTTLTLSNILPFVCIIVLFGRDHRGLHDLAAGTVVIDNGIR